MKLSADSASTVSFFFTTFNNLQTAIKHKINEPKNVILIPAIKISECSYIGGHSLPSPVTPVAKL